MVKPTLRTKSIGTKVTEEEYARLERAAQAGTKTLGEWCREVMLASANGQSSHAQESVDRIQFTAPSKELHVANRDLGTIEEINAAGDVAIRLDSGREVRFNVDEYPHLDHGYAVTSHSSQGQTAERVLIHVDTEQSEQLVNSRFAYVSVSRGQYDAQIYTNDGSELARDLSRDVSQRTATESQEQEPAGEKIETVSARHEEQNAEQTQAQGFEMGIG
jgi:ATP-dependent exoDNAse (exonuclease V) alpha subunit